MLKRLLNLFARGSSSQSETGGPDRPLPGRKTYRLAVPAAHIQNLVPHRLGAIVSDRVAVDGRSVGYMWRSAPANLADSGWAFLAGDEDDDFMNDPANHSIFAVNTVANHDPAIVPHLDAPVGSAFYRQGKGFHPDAQGPPGERA